MVIKTNLTWPFCIRRHIDVHPDTSVPFVGTSTQNILITHKLPLLCIVTKIEFNCHRIGNQKISVTTVDYRLLIDTIDFVHHLMILIALMVTKTHFQSPKFWPPNNLDFSYGDQKNFIAYNRATKIIFRRQ
jgi:hypothetical protein